MSRIQSLALAAFAAGAAALAADVPWVFQGDTAREPAASVSATTGAAFESWTHESRTGDSPAIVFSSFQPGTVMVFR